MKINDLFKHRSVTACLNNAYNLMTGNLKNMVKSTWVAVLPYAILTALFVYLRTPNKFLHDWGEGSPIMSFTLQSIVYLCLIVFSFLAGAIIWKWVTDKPFVRNLKRFFLATICSYVFVFVIVFVVVFCLIALYLALGLPIGEPAPGTSTTSSPVHLGIMVFAILLLSILAIILFLPFAYIIPRYMLLEDGEALHPWKSYKTGFRHSGAIFKMGFLGGLLIMVCNIVLYIPLSIIAGAQIFSQLGVLDGDPSGVPGYFTPLYLITSTIVFFIYYYIVNWLLLSYIYLYGSIESDEKEKARFLASNANPTDNIEE